MKAENINPFIVAVNELFDSMLDCKIRMGNPALVDEESKTPDMIGVIGMSGTAQGIVALKFPVSTALSIVGRMVGMEFRSVDSSIIDGVGEMVNIIAGSAKAKFAGHNINLSLPTVVRGNIYQISNLHNAVFLAVPFESDLGNFSMLVTFKPAVVPDKKEGIHAGSSS